MYDEIRAQVPKMNLDDVFVSKEQIAAAVKEELSKSMTGFGFQIVNTLITDIEPAAKVKAAMNDINAAQRLRLAAYEQSEAEKIRIVKAAEADAEAKFLAGQGIARQRQAIISGLRESVQTFQSEVSDVNSRDVMELLLITQYFDTLKARGRWGPRGRGGKGGGRRRPWRGQRAALAGCSGAGRVAGRVGSGRALRPRRHDRNSPLCRSQPRHPVPQLQPPSAQDIGTTSRSNTVFLPHGPGAVGDAASAIRNGLLTGLAGAPGHAPGGLSMTR